jgi:erythromycin esterase-like protein
VNLAGALHLLTGSPHGYDVLLERIGDASYVLLGEPSHGTHDFYRKRAAITQRLIEERGFTAVAAEAEELDSVRLERGIGVIYRPETERASHYFAARLPAQFDAVVHLDETTAVEPLERTSEWEAGELPETFPFAV